MTATPTWATRPDPGARHQLGQVEETARLLGTPLMPWQSLVARAATELTPDGRWRYPVVVITVPRQSGKTTLMRAVLVQRAITRAGLLAFYTAQTGKDATARWRDLVDAVETSPMGRFVDKRLAAGSSSLTFPNRSVIAPFAPTPKSLHGYTPPLVMVDEAFAFDAPQGRDLMGAIKPAQVTLPDRQLWIVSTAGSRDSVWLKSWVDAGRAATADPGSTVAYFEYSLAEGLDPYDPTNWATFHPALGHTISEAALADDAKVQPPGEWERAYCNRWTVTREAVMDLDTWDGLTGPLDPPTDPSLVRLAYDVAHDRNSAALWSAWPGADDRIRLRCIRSDQGLSWLRPEINLAREAIGGGVVVGADDGGPTRQITDELRRDGIPVETLGARDYATACGSWLWRAQNRLLVHDGSARLRAALEAAATRPMGEAWGFSRANSAGPIPDLVAAVVAARLADHAPPSPGKPVIIGAEA